MTRNRTHVYSINDTYANIFDIAVNYTNINTLGYLIIHDDLLVLYTEMLYRWILIALQFIFFTRGCTIVIL